MKFEIRETCGADAEKMIIYNKKVGSETDFLSFDGKTFDISEKKESGFLEEKADSMARVRKMHKSGTSCSAKWKEIVACLHFSIGMIT